VSDQAAIAREYGSRADQGRADVLELGIRANTMSPGFVTTAATEASMDKAMKDFVLSIHLIRRPGTAFVGLLDSAR
jgi:NAD(P)-dependent dehydrogenase (short-subunit alcohol dehydrogenase family)